MPLKRDPQPGSCGSMIVKGQGTLAVAVHMMSVEQQEGGVYACFTLHVQFRTRVWEDRVGARISPWRRRPAGPRGRREFGAAGGS